MTALRGPTLSRLARVVARTLERRELVARDERWLVAISGGPDSTALLAVLAELAPALGLALSAASVDHGLRPDAGRDVAAAAASAGRLGIPFAPLAARVAPGASRQQQARRARYRALAEHAAALGAVRIAVGHTIDDQAETVLLRILRGTGVRGLAGIAPQRPDGVVRPLIDCRRAEVHAHVAGLRLPVVNDPSNCDRRYQRVRVRLEVLPLLERLNPRIQPQLAALADDARDWGAGLDALFSGLEPLDGVTQLLALPAALRREALGRLARKNRAPSLLRDHLSALERMLSVGGEVWLPQGWVGRVDDGQRIVLERSAKRIGGRGRRSSEGNDVGSSASLLQEGREGQKQGD